jgi:LemA protein
MNRTVLVVLGVVALLVVGCGGFAASTYNSLVGLDQAVKAQWAQVENVYQRRADLIPNLVATVKAAAEFEQSTIVAVAEARSKVASLTVDKEVLDDPESFRRFQEAQDQLSSALSRLIAVAEAYPDLKATQNFRDLQAQLEGTENRITVERQRFNETAQAYDTARRRFPTMLFASMMGFEERPYFESQPGAEVAPKVEF